MRVCSFKFTLWGMKNFHIFVCAVGLFFAATAAAQNLDNLRVSFAGAVEKISPSIVNIYTEKLVKQRVATGPFSQFFNNPLVPHAMRQKVESSLGSGVIMSPEGHFVTNYHIIQGASSVRVVLHNGKELPTQLLAVDEAQDLAIMKIDLPEGEKLTPASLLNSDTVKVGDVALAIGNPYGFDQSVSMGIVSAVGRTNVGGPFGAFIQTDAAINPGSSGGALVDSNGNVIGINTLIFSKTGSNLGIGFAVPANAVRAVVQSVMESGEIKRGWFGAEGQNMNTRLAAELNTPVPYGVLVNTVFPNSPAAKAGLKVGDVILSFNGKKVVGSKALVAYIQATYLGQPVGVEVWREGQRKMLKVVTEETPIAIQPYDLTGNHPLDGYAVVEMNPAFNQQHGLPLGEEGVAIARVPQQQVFGISFRPGDVLKTINDRPINTLDDLQKALNDPRTAWRLAYTRGKATLKVYIQRGYDQR